MTMESRLGHYYIKRYWETHSRLFKIIQDNSRLFKIIQENSRLFKKLYDITYYLSALKIIFFDIIKK